MEQLDISRYGNLVDFLTEKDEIGAALVVNKFAVGQLEGMTPHELDCSMVLLRDFNNIEDGEKDITYITVIRDARKKLLINKKVENITFIRKFVRGLFKLN